MTKITSLTAQTSAASSDNLPIVDNSGTPTTKKITWANLIKSIISQVKGNLTVSDGTTLGALTVGSNNQVLTADSTQTYGMRWATPSGLGGQSGDMVYPLDVTIGDYSSPVAATASSVTGTIDNGFNASHTNSWNTRVYAAQFSGLTVGLQISKVGINISSAAGNIRVKIYDDSSNTPGALLAQSNSTAASGTGFQDISLTANATVGSSGKVWAAFETDSSSLDVYYTSGTSGYSVLHTYGTGPDPFSGASGYGQVNFRLTITGTIDGYTWDNNTSTAWTSGSDSPPYIYVDLSSARDIASVAIHLNTSTTTETQFKIQTSTDAVSWTDRRLINVSDFTNNTWRFFTLNRLSADARYVRIYGQGTSKILCINEIKVYYSPTTTQWNRLHFHKYLDPTTASATSLDSN